MPNNVFRESKGIMKGTMLPIKDITEPLIGAVID
jgi:hypothetical protein